MSPARKPKILICVTVAETAWSFFREQVPYLKEKGYGVEIASGEGSWKKLSDVREAFGVPVHRVPLTRAMNVVADIRSLARLYFLMRQTRPDVLHASTPKAAVLSLAAGWLARVPVRIYLVRGIAYYEATGMVRTLLSFVTMWACRIANVVLCVSASNRDFLVANRICPAEKISILCNGSSHGVDARARFNRANADPARLAALRAKFGVGDNDVVYGFTGRIVKDKGIEDLFAAWKRFATGRKNAHLFIVGHKEARGAVSAACLSGMAQEPSVHVVDDVNDPFEFYGLFDVFVFPSHREGLPNAVLEASAMELPVITTDALGCVDLVRDGETGYVVPVKNAAALLDRMEKLYADRPLRAALGRGGRAFVLDRFNPADVCAALEETVRLLCEKSDVFPRRRIAIVTSVPTTLFHLFSNQIDRIRREGFEVFLISSAGDEWISAGDVEKKYGITIRRVPFHRTFSVFSDLYSLAALCALLARLRLDVIYYCTPKASLLAAIAALLVRVPFRIYSVFGQVYYGKKGVTEKILLLAELLSCACSHKVILMSESNLRYMSVKKLCRPDKMGILGRGTNQGVDARGRFNPENIDRNSALRLRQKLDIPEKTAVIGYMGRLVKEKGIRELVQAWSDIRKGTVPCILLLIGPRKEPRDQLPQNVFDKIANDPTIRLIEPVPDPESFYAIMDIFILPSYREGFPNVVLEAAAMGLPVITTNAIGCIDSVLDNETGFVVPVMDVDKMKEKINVLLHNPEMRRNMGAKARERVLKDFDCEAITEELMYLINNRDFHTRTYGI
jgi:glycosyltransferase involved in cell wall biosynthesis